MRHLGSQGCVDEIGDCLLVGQAQPQTKLFAAHQVGITVGCVVSMGIEVGSRLNLGQVSIPTGYSSFIKILMGQVVGNDDLLDRKI